jgi:hypothetical protein
MNITTRMPPSLEKEKKFKYRTNETRNISFYNNLSNSIQKDSILRDSFDVSNENSFEFRGSD